MKKSKRQKMVGWYDPVQLGRTAVQVLISTLLGKHEDKRALESLASTGEMRPKYIYEVNDKSGEFWFDYIADVGDGFNSTYTTAYYATRPELDLISAENPSSRHLTRRGSLLVLGGDEVYPFGDWDAYQERLARPYNLALPAPTRAKTDKATDHPRPALFAIPGNHDWYDSLVAFNALFMREKEFCGWQTEQNRSYFAIKLPLGWWLFGTDMQLGSALDEAQMNFFERIVKNHLTPEDQIILCNAEPHWITASMYPEERSFSEKNMGYFEGHILNHQVAVFLAGDRHYYKRHEEISNRGNVIDPASEYKRQKIVAGGGGAFLHPTHKENVDIVGFDHKYKHRRSFPSEPVSSGLAYWNLLFILWNWKLGVVTGALYVLTSQAFLADLGKFGIDRLPEAISNVAAAGLTKPIALFWFLIIVGAFFLFTDTHSKIYRFLGGFFHAVTHLVVVLLIGWEAAYSVGSGRFIEQFSLSELLFVGLLIFGGGFLAGPIIMGLYLLISLNIFGRHHNETFSAIKIEDYKNFLRFKIEENGDLVIYPVGFKRAVKKWKEGNRAQGEAELIPDSPNSDSTPFLIEEPIRFAKSRMPRSPGPNQYGSQSGDADALITKVEI